MLHDSATGRTTSSAGAPLPSPSGMTTGPRFVPLGTGSTVRRFQHHHGPPRLSRAGSSPRYGATLDKDRVVWISYAPFHLEWHDHLSRRPDDLPSTSTPTLRAEFRDMTAHPTRPPSGDWQREASREALACTSPPPRNIFRLDPGPSRFHPWLEQLLMLSRSHRRQRPRRATPFKDVQVLERRSRPRPPLLRRGPGSTRLMKGITAIHFVRSTAHRAPGRDGRGRAAAEAGVPRLARSGARASTDISSGDRSASSAGARPWRGLHDEHLRRHRRFTAPPGPLSHRRRGGTASDRAQRASCESVGRR